MNDDIVKTGLEIKFTGFTKNVLICICNFFDAFFNVDLVWFSFAKKCGMDTFNETSSKLPRDYVYDILKNEIYRFYPSSKSVISKRAKLKSNDIKLEHKYYLEMFVCSDTTPEPFLALFDYLYSQKIKPSKKFHHEHSFSNKILECTTTNKKHNAVGIFLKNTSFNDIKSIAMMKIILPYYQKKFIDKLKTEKNLGYLVDLTEEDINGIQYIGFIVQSEYDCETTKENIMGFINWMRSDLKDLKIETLQKMKNSFADIYSGEYSNLKDFFNNYAFYYYNDAFRLDYNNEMVEAINSIVIGDLKLPQEMITVKVKKKIATAF